MDSLFLQWIAATDAYARRQADARKGDPRAFSDLRLLAADVQRQDSTFFTPTEFMTDSEWPATVPQTRETQD